jgi:predicted RNA-binding Zn-ribbon protein involved in translation (DUF1610 family)
VPRLTVFACPSCGASLGVEEGAASAQCQFCGNTVMVPEELRGKAPRSEPAPAPPPAMFGSLPGLPDLGKMKQMGDAVRAGNKFEAIRLYQELFGVGPAEARAAIDTMAAGGSVSVNTMSAGSPSVVQRNAAALGSPFATSSQPMIVSTRPARSSGCVALFIVLLAAMVVLVGVLVAIAVLVPAMGGSLGEVVGAVTNSYPRVVLSFGGEGTGAGLFTDPRAIAVGPDGAIYVSEFNGGVVKVFNPDGKFVRKFSAGADDSSIIQGMAADQAGYLYVAADSLVHRIHAESGENLGPVDYEQGWGFNDVAVSPDGGLVASWYKADDNLIYFDNDLRVVRIVENAISGVTGDSELSLQVAVNGDGEAYLLGKFNNAVFHYGAEGQFIGSFGSQGDEPGRFRAPSDIAVDGQGRVYVSDFKGIQVFTPDGQYLSVIKGPNGGYVNGLAFDEAGYLYALANVKKVFKYQLEAPAQ